MSYIRLDLIIRYIVSLCGMLDGGRGWSLRNIIVVASSIFKKGKRGFIKPPSYTKS